MMGGGSGMMGGKGMMGGMMGGASETAGDYWKSDEKKVMIRALDFTVEPDTTYRYRVRIVVFNPNHNHEDVSPTAAKTVKLPELAGPWSQETDEVSMPTDVMPYAIGSLAANAKNDTQVRFQVVRFNPEDGVTVPRNFDASAGDVIGGPRTAEIPSSEGAGKRSKNIDFTSHQVVLDVAGGKLQQLPPGITGTPIEKPALAVLLRPDGSIAVHNQADDTANEVRKDIDSNYHHELSQSTKKRERGGALGMGYMGMGGGMQNMMMRMMGGGMGGGRGR
jgi:hypothetical protein